MLPITSVFAALLTLYFLRLAMAVIHLRRSNKVALGDGGVKELEGAIRAHGNFAEYVPFGLILMGLLEANGGYPLLIVVLGCTLTVGRILQATALGKGNLKLRVTGMKMTVLTLVALSVTNLIYVAIFLLRG